MIDPAFELTMQKLFEGVPRGVLVPERSMVLLTSKPIGTDLWLGLIPVRVSDAVPPGKAYLINPGLVPLRIYDLPTCHQEEQGGQEDAGVVERVAAPDLGPEAVGADHPGEERGTEQEEQEEREHGPSPRLSPDPQVNRECWEES